jgi:ABC-type antimicrobial peptide transport system ATPase subunit
MPEINKPDHMLAIEHLTKKFGDFKAVEDISLTVSRGKIFGFLGPNGAGKTTTIKMIAGLLKPDAGKISIITATWRKYQDTASRIPATYLTGPIYSRNLPVMNFSSSLPVCITWILKPSQRIQRIISSFSTCWNGSTILSKAIHTVCGRN